jgi:NAD(P)-dependent dehydrogenase (short-subunit alcohol dehydrogenase family)
MLFSAVITGGASGIGEAVCRKLASRGINLLVADLQVDRGTTLAKELKQRHGIDAHFLRVDVMQEQDIKQMVGTAVKHWGRLDYAANCAGICEKVWDEEESITSAIFDRTYAINARGIWLCQKYQALQMKKQEARPVTFNPPGVDVPAQRGSICNIASISGLHAQGLAAYTPSKWAAVGITKNGAKFYGPSGIRCNAVCPGPTFSPMIEHSLGDAGRVGSDESTKHPLLEQISIGRFGFAEEQANAVSFLLSSESSYMNGATLVNDGGYHDIR